MNYHNNTVNWFWRIVSWRLIACSQATRVFTHVLLRLGVIEWNSLPSVRVCLFFRSGMLWLTFNFFPLPFSLFLFLLFLFYSYFSIPFSFPFPSFLPFYQNNSIAISFHCFPILFHFHSILLFFFLLLCLVFSVLCRNLPSPSTLLRRCIPLVIYSVVPYHLLLSLFQFPLHFIRFSSVPFFHFCSYIFSLNHLSFLFPYFFIFSFLYISSSHMSASLWFSSWVLP